MKVLLGLTGASGSIYGITLLRTLREKGVDVQITITKTGHQVCMYETGINIKDLANDLNVSCHDIDNLFAPPASGSHRLDAVIILPCSMGTLGRIAGGMSSNLLERAADVALKEGFKLILAPRETPLNTIHLENMTKLAHAGAVIVPPSVAFYTKPETLEDIILFHTGKILDLLGLDHSLFSRWGNVE
ncbi:MAG: aromatic acid decarboxylase [bacterium]|nr:MAG: aromatic acid decarboxylase [bacterium]